MAIHHDSLSILKRINKCFTLKPSLIGEIDICRGETASGRSRRARARQIARAEELQAQDARATKQARPQTKKQEGTRVNTMVKLKLKLKPVNRIHFRYEALDSREQRVARLWDRRPEPSPWPAS